MEATLLNKKFEAISIIDTYKSFIWTDRCDEAGDFEIEIPISMFNLHELKKEYYLWNEHSEHLMIIESFEVNSDDEEGPSFIVSGRSLESLLNRRVIWKQNSENKLIKTKFVANDAGEKYNLQDAIETLLIENIIDPDIEVRKIDNFIFKRSTDERITSLTLDAEYLGEDLYETISTLCKENEICFKVTLNDENQFVFELYVGTDRSYEQTENDYVIFSPEFDNVANTNYLDSNQGWKNVALVAGEEMGDGKENVRDIYVHGFASGLDRREVFVDANDVSTDDDGGVLEAERYYAILKKRGIDALIENVYVQAFEGEVEPNKMYVYGEDYFIGDIVQIADDYGNEGRAYISELVLSCDTSGTYMYPTFKTIEKEVYET